jgi:hypothetical protein
MKLTPFDPDLKTLVDRIDAGDIDLQPEFQRQEIWPVIKKRRLIDTIIRGWAVPPIFLVEVDDGRLEVLDGQQRLAAIRDFLHDSFSIDGSITPPDDKVQGLGGTFYSGLERSHKRMVDQYPLRCFRLTDYQPDEPSELFYRLNQPTMLTAGEQRNAFFGPAREQLKDLVVDFEGWGNRLETIGFSNARLAYDDIIARLLVFLENRSFSVKGTEAQISQRFKERRAFDINVKTTASFAMAMFSQSRDVAGKLKLNKANTLSWLIFFCRFASGEKVELEYMSYFSNMLPEFGSDPVEVSAARMFQNRSSLRVTDVSSVVYRDFALWLVYEQRHGTVPIAIDTDTISTITGLCLNGSANETIEEILGKNLDLQAWGQL